MFDSSVNVVALCLGTNQGPGTAPLRFAEKDAFDVANVFEGVIGTATRSEYMLAPTVKQAVDALKAVAARQPEVFYFYNSGHGGSRGVLLRDGTLTYDALANWVRAIRAQYSLTMLDVCHAGMYLEKSSAWGDVIVSGVGFDYLQALSEATKGNRVFASVGADRLAGEGQGVENGHFTASLLEALSRTRASQYGMVMDEDLFKTLAKISVIRWQQLPYARGLTNDLPIVHGQPHLLGGASEIGTNVTAEGLSVSALITGRAGVPTRWRGTLRSRSGRALANHELMFVPHEDSHFASVRFSIPIAPVIRDPASQVHLLLRRPVQLVWEIALEDMRGRMLQLFQQVIWWRPLYQVA